MIFQNGKVMCVANVIFDPTGDNVLLQERLDATGVKGVWPVIGKVEVIDLENPLSWDVSDLHRAVCRETAEEIGIDMNDTVYAGVHSSDDFVTHFFRSSSLTDNVLTLEDKKYALSPFKWWRFIGDEVEEVRSLRQMRSRSVIKRYPLPDDLHSAFFSPGNRIVQFQFEQFPTFNALGGPDFDVRIANVRQFS